MSKYLAFDNLVRKGLKFIYGNNSIIGKPFRNTSLFLYYNPIEHLVFLGKKEVFYEKILQDKVEKIIKNGHCVFDIGANIGQYALLFSNLVSISGNVISIEPDNDNFAFLSFNKYKNNCKNLTLLNKGVGDENKSMRLYKDTLTGGRKSSLIREFRGEGNEEQEIDVITLDYLIENFGVPNFIKIDIEGFEKTIVESLPLYIVEKDITWMIEVRDTTKKACFDTFNSTHLCYVIDAFQDYIVTNSDMIPDFANLLFIPQKTD